MNAPASPHSIEFRGDASLGAVLTVLQSHFTKALVLHYAGRTIRPGYHVTEVKAGSFVTLDCGGNPDAWQETILQVEDLGPDGTRDYMSAGKFAGILEQVQRRIALDSTARLTFEIGTPEVPMQVFDVNTLDIGSDRVELRLAARAATCKPRHRAAIPAATTKCCAPGSDRTACCA